MCLLCIFKAFNMWIYFSSLLVLVLALPMLTSATSVLLLILSSCLFCLSISPPMACDISFRLESTDPTLEFKGRQWGYQSVCQTYRLHVLLHLVLPCVVGDSLNVRPSTSTSTCSTSSTWKSEHCWGGNYPRSQTWLFFHHSSVFTRLPLGVVNILLRQWINIKCIAL